MTIAHWPAWSKARLSQGCMLLYPKCLLGNKMDSRHAFSLLYLIVISLNQINGADARGLMSSQEFKLWGNCVGRTVVRGIGVSSRAEELMRAKVHHLEAIAEGGASRPTSITNSFSLILKSVSASTRSASYTSIPQPPPTSNHDNLTIPTPNL